jgi:hypothetical protein
MGFFKKDKPASVEPVQVMFGSEYIAKCNEISKLARQGKKNISMQFSLEFDNNLLREIDDCIQSHSATNRVLYSDNMQDLNIVGESFNQTGLKNLFNQVQSNWLAGFLMPEPLNPYDTNAVSVIVISPDTNNKGEYNATQVGHLSKEQAKKVSAKLIDLTSKDTFIPILAKLNGGTSDKPNIGVFGRAKTDKIRF